MQGLLSAAQAAERLKISKDTLYAYVSRGLIESVLIPGQRQRHYRQADIERLQQKKAARQSPERAVKSALAWQGLPILYSSISQIKDQRLSYRNVPLEQILCWPDLEHLVCHLWGLAELPEVGLRQQSLVLASDPTSLSWFERVAQALPVWAQLDLQALNLSPLAVQQSAWTLLLALFHSLHQGQGLLQGFVGQLKPRELDLLRLVLFLSAEHELNISAFTARCVASAQASPYLAINAAWCALSGRLHGGQTLRVQVFIQHCLQADSISQGIKTWLQQTETLPGFGHPLYPAGDPRWLAFKAYMQTHFTEDPQWARFADLCEQGSALMQAEPSLDFVLVAASQQVPLALTALDLFALGRSIGWLAHIQEQYQTPGLIRPRAEMPAGSGFK